MNFHILKIVLTIIIINIYSYGHSQSLFHLTIQTNPNGENQKYYINNILRNQEELKKILQETDKDTDIFINFVDSYISQGELLKIFQLLKNAGFKKVSLVIHCKINMDTSLTTLSVNLEAIRIDKINMDEQPQPPPGPIPYVEP